MGGYGTQITLIIFLILVNAALSGSEMALVSLRDGQVKQLEQRSRSGPVLARLAHDPNRFLATVQIGITLAGFLASAAAAVSLTTPLIGLLGALGPAAGPVAVLGVTLALTFVTLVVGELAPKRVAMQRAEGWALAVARPLDVLAKVMRPAVWLLGKSTDAVVRLAGGDPGAARAEVGAEEIRDIVTTQRSFSAQQRAILSGAFEIAERTLRQVLVPRRDVTVLPATLPAIDGMRELVRSGHSRAPVVGPGGLDEVVGVVHIRDLLDTDGPVGGRARPPLFLPETLHVSDAMRQMRQERQQMAMIVEERGAIDGIVTMEDLVEEVVGEIYDETDRDVATVQRQPDGSMLVPGAFPIHDLPDIGVHLDNVESDAYTTIAGFLLTRLGHIPTEAGETVDLGRYTAEVAGISGRAITRVRLRPEPGA